MQHLIFFVQINVDNPLALQKAKFGVMEYLALAGIIGIGPLEGFLVDAAPAMAIQYNSILGFVVRITVIVVSAAVYIIIGRINSPVSVKADDRGKWAAWLLRHQTWKRLITDIAVKSRKRHPNKPRTPTAYERLNKQLTVSLSKMDVHHITTKKLMSAVIVFAAALAIISAATALGRHFIQNTTAPLTLVGGAIRTPEEEAALARVDA